jgi:hypothetical protein
MQKIAKNNIKISQFRGVIKPSETSTVQRRWRKLCQRSVQMSSSPWLTHRPFRSDPAEYAEGPALRSASRLRPTKAKRGIFVVVIIFLRVANVKINEPRIRFRLSGLRLKCSSSMAEEVTGYFLGSQRP